jgi:hypothetical protein
MRPILWACAWMTMWFRRIILLPSSWKGRFRSICEKNRAGRAMKPAQMALYEGLTLQLKGTDRL